MKKIFLLPLLLFLTGCNITVLDPKSDTASEQAFLIEFSFWIMMFVVVTVFILFTYFVIKYRYTETRKHDLPQDVKGNIKLEITWITIPVLLLVVLAVPTLAITYNQSPQWTEESDQSGVVIDVVGKQFNWIFTHANGAEEMDKLVIPEGKSIVLNLKSADVIHSFWVPHLGGKVDVMPGKELTYEINNPKKGTYQGKCAEYCGLGHTDMTFEVKVVSKQVYEQYLQK